MKASEAVKWSSSSEQQLGLQAKIQPFSGADNIYNVTQGVS